MNEHVRHLMAQMEALEAELSKALQQQEIKFSFKIKGKRIEFENSVKQAHKKLKTGMVKWLADRPQNLITGPIIYGMILPMIMLDICLSFYQATCFPIYKIAKVKRSDYIIFDRQQLGYLNFIEKFHCTYCAYGNGLLAYATEVVAKTEQYFCPIKHARKMLGMHSKYAQFIEYGDAHDYAARLEKFRVELAER